MFDELRRRSFLGGTVGAIVGLAGCGSAGNEDRTDTAAVIDGRSAGLSWRQLAGPQGGPVSDIAVSRADPDTLYATTRTAGVYASHDGGRNWIQGQSKMHHRRAVFPSPHDRELAYTRNDRLMDGGRSGTETPWGVYHPDGESLFSSNEQELFALLFDPADEDVRYAATSIGFFRSTDAALSWDRLAIPGAGDQPTVGAAASHPDRTGTLLAAVNGIGVYRSTDGGETWARLPGTNGILGRAHRISFHGPDEAYLSVYDRGLYHLSGTGPDHLTGHGSRFPEIPGRFDVLSNLPVSAGGERVYFITAEELWSDDGLAVEDRVLYAYEPAADAVQPVPTPTAPITIATHPTEPSTLYVGGLKWVHESRDGGETWDALNDGFIDRYLTAVAVNPSRPGTVMPGTVCSGGLFVSRDNGRTFDWKRSGLSLFHTQDEFNEHYIMQIAAAAEYAYATTGAGLLISEDNGDTWHLLENEFSGVGEFVHGQMNRPTHLHGLAVAPDDPRTVYVGTGRGGPGHSHDAFDGTFIWKSEDAGESWREITAGFPTHLDSTVQDIYVSPVDPDVVFAGLNARDYLGQQDAGDAGGLYVSRDGGAAWRAVEAPFDNVHAIGHDGGQQPTLYVSTPVGVFRSGDESGTWEQTLPDESKGLVAHPGADGLVFAGIRRYNGYWDLFVTRDGGDSWRSADLTIQVGQEPEGRPAEGIDLHGDRDGGSIPWLALDTTGEWLYAATHGAGLWRGNIQPLLQNEG